MDKQPFERKGLWCNDKTCDGTAWNFFVEQILTLLYSKLYSKH